METAVVDQDIAKKWKWPGSKTPGDIALDWWERAGRLEKKVQGYAKKELDKFKTDPVITEQIDSLLKMHTELLDAGQALYVDLIDSQVAIMGDIDAVGLIDDLEKLLGDLFEKLKNEFPPPDHAPGHAERKESIERALTQLEETLVSFLQRRGLSEEVIRAHLDKIIPLLEKVMITIGKL